MNFVLKKLLIKLKKYIHNPHHNINKRQYFLNFLEISSYIKDSNIATMLLDVFSCNNIEISHLGSIIKLKEEYGKKYCINLLEKWAKNAIESSQSEHCFDKIYHINKELLQKKEDELAIFLLKYQLESIKRLYKNHTSYKAKDILDSLPKRINYVKDLLQSCIDLSKEENVLTELILYLQKNIILYPYLELSEIFIALNLVNKNDIFPSYEILLNHIKKGFEKELEQGLRKNNDWSIQHNLTCNCEYCTELQMFLESNEKQKIWAIVQATRSHIAYSLEDMLLPLKIETLKKGSPHKLILTKENIIHKNSATRLKEVQIAHNKLNNA